MTSTQFVEMYHPALGNARASVSLSSVDDHAARGWLLVGGGTPAPSSPYLTPAVGDSRYLRADDVDDAGTPTGAALRAASVAAVEGELVVEPVGQWDFGLAPTVNGVALGAGGGGSSQGIDVFDVTDYGAARNGTTNDAPAIAAAVAAAQASTSGRQRTVYFPPGNYRVSSVVNSPASNRSALYFTGLTGIKFYGPGATITSTVANATVLEIKDSTDVQVEELSVVGPGTMVEDGANTRGIGIRFTKVTRGKILGCSTANTGHGGIWLTGGVYDCVVDQNSVLSTKLGGGNGINLDCLADAYGQPFVPAPTYGNRITNNYIKDLQGYAGIAIDTNGLDTATIVSGNVLINMKRFGITCHDGKNVQIVGNHIENTPETAILVDFGIYTAGPTDNVMVFGNNIVVADRGIDVFTAEATTTVQMLTISGNHLSKIQTESIRVYRKDLGGGAFGGKFFDVSIANNVMRSVGIGGAPATYDCVDVEIVRAVITGNIANGVKDTNTSTFRYGLNVRSGSSQILAANLFTGTPGAATNDPFAAITLNYDGNAGEGLGTSFVTKNRYWNATETNGGGANRVQRLASTPNAPGGIRGLMYFRDGTQLNTLKLCVRAGDSGVESIVLDNIPMNDTLPKAGTSTPVEYRRYTGTTWPVRGTTSSNVTVFWITSDPAAPDPLTDNTYMLAGVDVLIRKTA